MPCAPFSDEHELAEGQPHPLPLEDFLDLHTFSPGEVASVAEEYLLSCRDAGILEVRIIHGRGRGVQRRIVQSLLSRLPFVRSFSDAPPERGGWGATIVYLEPSDRYPPADRKREG